MLSDGFILKREDRNQKDIYIQLLDYSGLDNHRQPDADQGFILLGWMTKGQILTVPMIVVGIILLVYAYKRDIYDWGKQSAY